jgi:hypothetical protein
VQANAGDVADRDGCALPDDVLLSIVELPAFHVPGPWCCDSDAVTGAMDAEAELFSAPPIPRSVRAALRAEPGLPMTLGNAAGARVRLIVWCKGCQHQAEPDPRRDGCSVTRRDYPARLQRAAGLFPLRQPAGRYGGDRDCVAPVNTSALRRGGGSSITSGG